MLIFNKLQFNVYKAYYRTFFCLVKTPKPFCLRSLCFAQQFSQIKTIFRLRYGRRMF